MRSVAWVLGLVVVAATFGLACGQQQSEEPPEVGAFIEEGANQIDTCIDEHGKGNYAEAMVACEKAVGIDPSNPKLQEALEESRAKIAEQ